MILNSDHALRFDDLMDAYKIIQSESISPDSLIISPNIARIWTPERASLPEFKSTDDNEFFNISIEERYGMSIFDSGGIVRAIGIDPAAKPADDKLSFEF